MNIEEKAKAYDEALKKIQPLYEQAKKDYNPIWSTYEHLFPELRESEDERMRRKTINCLTMHNKGCVDAKDIDECIAWLEKQKEPENTSASTMAPSCWEVEQEEQKPADEQFPPLEGLDAIKAKYYDDGFKNGFAEGVESVKPAEWSPTKEQMVALIWAANGMLDNDSPSAGDIKASLRSLYNYLQSKSIRPAEWSEEDYHWVGLIQHLRDYQKTIDRSSNNLAYESVEEYIDWLKSLRPQYHGDVTMTEAYKMGLEAGKASSWKPSEVHLSALLAVFNDPNNIGSQTCQLALTDLYEQLKKL